jgi:hypothetical protein
MPVLCCRYPADRVSLRTRLKSSPTASDPASRHGRALMSLHAPWHETLPPGTGGLWRHHVSHGARPCLPAREGSGVATCPMAPDPTWHGRALASPCVPRRHTPPPGTEGLRRCHVPRSVRSRLPAQDDSDVATCPVAPDPPPDEGGLWCRHVSHGTRLPAWEGSSVATCHMALDVLWATSKREILSRSTYSVEPTCL